MDEYGTDGSACDRARCPSHLRLPCAWIDILTKFFNNPENTWRNFNDLYRYRGILKMYTSDQWGMLCNNDLPDPPDPLDFSSR